MIIMNGFILRLLLIPFVSFKSPWAVCSSRSNKGFIDLSTDYAAIFLSLLLALWISADFDYVWFMSAVSAGFSCQIQKGKSRMIGSSLFNTNVCQHSYLLSLSPSLFFSVYRELHRAGPGRSGRSPAGLVPTAPRQRQAEQHGESCSQFCIKWGSNIYLASAFIFRDYSSFTTDQQHTVTLTSFILVVSFQEMPQMLFYFYLW